VTFSGPLTTAPAISAPGPITDLSPVGAIVNPGEEEVDAAVPTQVAVLADDDFGIASVSLKADGTPVATATTSPYTFEWTPSPADRGETVTLEATITDSAGKTATAELDVEITAQALPVVSNQPVGAITKTTAVLNGKVDNEGDEEGSTCGFEVTTATDLTFLTPVDTVDCTPNPVTGSTATDVTATVAGLEAGTAYIYRVVATNAGGTVAGTPAVAFSTEAEPRKEEPKEEPKKEEPPVMAPPPVVIGPPSTGKLAKDTEKGTAQLKVTAPGAGTVTVSGEGIRKVTKAVTGPVTIQSLVKAKGKKLKTLNQRGRVTVKVTVTFTATDGTVTTTTRTLTLVKK
jgi:hypothetical protein